LKKQPSQTGHLPATEGDTAIVRGAFDVRVGVPTTIPRRVAFDEKKKRASRKKPGGRWPRCGASLKKKLGGEENGIRGRSYGGRGARALGPVSAPLGPPENIRVFFFWGAAFTQRAKRGRARGGLENEIKDGLDHLPGPGGRFFFLTAIVWSGTNQFGRAGRGGLGAPAEIRAGRFRAGNKNPRGGGGRKKSLPTGGANGRGRARPAHPRGGRGATQPSQQKGRFFFRVSGFFSPTFPACSPAR